MAMTDVLDGVRDHYRATGLTDRLKTALIALGPENQRLMPQQLAALDQFHTRGLAATTELGKLAGVGFGRRRRHRRAGALSGRDLRLPSYGHRPQRAIRGCRALSDRAYGTERTGVV